MKNRLKTGLLFLELEAGLVLMGMGLFWMIGAPTSASVVAVFAFWVAPLAASAAFLLGPHE